MGNESDHGTPIPKFATRTGSSGSEMTTTVLALIWLQPADCSKEPAMTPATIGTGP
jgi:hypothetical protein